MTSSYRNSDQFLRDLKWVTEHDVLDNPLMQNLARAIALGAEDKEIEDIWQEQLQARKMAHVVGQIPQFRKSRLHEGEINFGKDVLSGEDVRVPLQWLAAGVLLCGGTGAGKTLFLVWLVLQIVAANPLHPCRVWISDMYRTQIRNLIPLFRQIGHDLLVYGPRDWKWNPLEPDGCDPRIHLNMIVDTLVRRLGLPPRARITLQQAIHYLYDKYGIWNGRSDAAPVLPEIYEWVYNAPASVSHPLARDAILDRLGGFIMDVGPKQVAYRVSHKASDLAKHSIVFEMRGASEQVKRIFLESHLFAVLQHEMEKGNFNSPLDLFMVVDDAQRFVDSAQPNYRSDDFQYGIGEMNPMEELASVIRGGGKGMCVVTQSMVGLSRRLTPNLATKIMGRSSSFSDALRLGQDMGMNREKIEDCQKILKPGRFVVQVSEGDWREPCLISVPLLNMPNVVSDEEAAESVKALDYIPTVAASEYENWQPQHIRSAIIPKKKKKKDSQGEDGSTPSNPDAPLAMELLEYLKSIARKPFLNATERDENIGVTASKGNTIRKKFIQQGLVNPISINPGSGRGRSFQLLELTDEGLDLLRQFGVKPSAGHGRGKLAHRWWCHTISEWLNSRGVKSVIEDDSLGARVDISVMTGNQRIAIEVEMSRGHELENVKKDLRAGFSQVVSLVKEPAAVQRVKAKLEGELGTSSGSVHVGNLKEYADIITLALS